MKKKKKEMWCFVGYYLLGYCSLKLVFAQRFSLPRAIVLFFFLSFTDKIPDVYTQTFQVKMNATILDFLWHWSNVHFSFAISFILDSIFDILCFYTKIWKKYVSMLWCFFPPLYEMYCLCLVAGWYSNNADMYTIQLVGDG